MPKKTDTRPTPYEILSPRRSGRQNKGRRSTQKDFETDSTDISLVQSVPNINEKNSNNVTSESIANQMISISQLNL